jgi:hypothetical protein
MMNPRASQWTGAFGLTVFGLCVTGCALSDPNHNPKVRYAWAHQHAERVLRDAGTQLSPYSDYDLMTFYRRQWDESAEVMHKYELYDFLKICATPGPPRFVIAYDMATRKTYLRADLRSNENLERLPPSRDSRKAEGSRE